MGDAFEKRGDRCFLKGSKHDVEILEDLTGFLTPVGDVKADPANPRKTVLIGDLVAGIRRFGIRWPILVNKRTGIIEAGHQRLFAAQELGLSHVPVIWADDDNVTATSFNISDNRLGEIVAEWDDEALAKQLKAMMDDADDALDALDGLGFDEEEASWMISEYLDGQGGGTEPPEPPSPDEVPAITQLGDVWELGPHRLICGDSTQRAVLDRVLDGEQAKMIFTDPPYNVAYGNGAVKMDKHREIENDDLGEDFRPFLLDVMRAMLPVCEGAIYICMSSSELDTLQSTFREAGGHWSTFIIWSKNTFTIGRSDYQRQYEPILYGWREGAKGRHWCGDRDQADVWHYDKPKRNDIHPTMKPIELVERAIKNSSLRDDIVFDSFMGSGTTIMAAEKLGRRGYGVELDTRYCDVICQRYHEMTGTSPVRKSDSAKWAELALDQDVKTGNPKKRKPKKE